MKLTDYGEPLAYETAFWMQCLNDSTYPIDELGETCLEICKNLRSLAILTLLVNANTDAFYHNLIRSGLARLSFLNRLESEGLSDHYHRASGRFDALVDTIAAGDWELANKISTLSPSELFQGKEYEDDYCIAQILQSLVSGGEFAIPRLIEQYDLFLDGETDYRLDSLRAIYERDQDAFDEAFESTLDQRELEILAAKEASQFETPQVIAERHIYVFGLAILKIATSRNLQTKVEYRFCPSLARTPMFAPFPGE